MGICISMDSAEFFVPVEYIGHVIKPLTELCYAFDFDANGNIYEVQFIGDKLANNEVEILASIAPYVKAGSFIEVACEDGQHIRWEFDGSTVKERKSKQSWDDDESWCAVHK